MSEKKKLQYYLFQIMQSISCGLFFSFCILFDNSWLLILHALFPFQKSDSSLSDFLSDEDVNPSKETGKTKTVKKADSVNHQKNSSASDQDPKVTEIKSR